MPPISAARAAERMAPRPSMPRLLVLGAGLGLVPRIRAARAAGFFCIVADDLPVPHGFVVADAALQVRPDDVAALRKGVAALGGVDAVLGTNEATALAAAQLGRALGLRGAAEPEIVAQGLDKLAQRQAWQRRAPEYHVPHRLLRGPEELPGLAAALGGFPLVLKPQRSTGGSRGVSLVEGEAGLAEAYAFAATSGLPGSAVLAEAALPGPQFSCETLLRDGVAHCVAVGRKVKSPPPARVDLAVVYDRDADQWRAEAARMVGALCAALGFRDGATHTEFAATPAGLRPIELAMRCGGGLTPDLAGRVGGVDPFLAEARRACSLPETLPPPAAPIAAEACFRFLLFPPGQALRAEIPEGLRQEQGVVAAEIFLAGDGRIAPLRWTSQRSGWIGLAQPPEASPGVVARSEALAARLRLHYADGSAHPPLPCGAAAAGPAEPARHHPAA